jgi:hypothetical protein
MAFVGTLPSTNSFALERNILILVGKLKKANPS